jgi:hypothetical protein
VYKAEGVTLLITHYNRSDSLARGLGRYRELGVTFEDIVVSDDGSRPEHVTRLHALATEFGFRLLTTPVNEGLGHNLNKGQDAVRTPYTLYVQEDFCATDALAARLGSALRVLASEPDIDVVRLYAGVEYPYRVSRGDGYSELKFSLLKPGTAKFFCYSDTPHLRRGSFSRKFGRYAEGIPAIKTEKAMVMSFLQAGGRAIQCDVSDVFVHENTDAEPSTQNYSAFFRIKRVLPDAVFDALWTVKLTAEFLARRYRA